MKFASLLVLGLISFSAFAEVKPRGAFVPNLCSQTSQEGATIDIVAVESVCLGELNGLNQQAVQLVINDGTTRTYSIDMKKPVVRMGATTTNFKGVNIDDQDETIKGRLVTISGIRLSHNIELQTSSNLEFANSLEIVFVTQ